MPNSFDGVYCWIFENVWVISAVRNRSKETFAPSQTTTICKMAARFRSKHQNIVVFYCIRQVRTDHMYFGSKTRLKPLRYQNSWPIALWRMLVMVNVRLYPSRHWSKLVVFDRFRWDVDIALWRVKERQRIFGLLTALAFGGRTFFYAISRKCTAFAFGGRAFFYAISRKWELWRIR